MDTYAVAPSICVFRLADLHQHNNTNVDRASVCIGDLEKGMKVNATVVTDDEHA